MTILIEQFKVLLDPSTALGAFLISMGSGAIISFIFGFSKGKNYEKKNILKLNNNYGEVNQDVKVYGDSNDR